MFDFLPQFERLDASYGDVLINDGKGSFSWTPQKKAGLHVQGEVKDMAVFKDTNGATLLLFLINNSSPVMYTLH